MDQSLFLILLFSGLSILPSSLPHQFHFVNLIKTWTEAQSFCRQNYTDLVTIDDDMADMKKLNNTVSAAGWIESAWIGLYNIMDIWRWSLGNRELEVEGFWAQGQTNIDPNSKDVCVCMMQNGSWFNNNCNTTWNFVCYDKNATNKYIHINESKTWSDAQSYCREKHTDLASVRNTTEMQAIKTITLTHDNNPTYRAWIGLHKPLGVWRWSDQSGSSYRNWDSNEPNGAGMGKEGYFCGEVKLSGKWNDKGCTHEQPFICYDDELVLVSENKTWSEALWHCRQLDMELVSAHNQNIQHWVQQRAKKASTPFVWLGLRYTCTLDIWFWVNGEESCYHNWAVGEGYNTIKEQCENTGAIQRDGGQWVGKSETERFNFICSNSTDY
ncbi:macrophage mannose receptor 1-like [Oncorhynchus keta]|uniref:macrophage mannose receptor 1-like n=1 Tax=Oncorhynchus keta TaxID=8018 RepID=UPI00227A7367|nr:macrophage mannose receptor 1-like [Oncorhynchus keta]XP_052376204.1 macrophage mannose receptor 1-like [Oncorhynchus keta]XP_052376205.1 macrophage mannose receptor 1-like [Oncorhynchus keta]XP_052376206.1 macrophage mannose receptor 1-like [Oncorhynchus keta]XP_052376207.1 macrophage mannose receptor 1-like [Oncorhynchus keta]XP_052376208.1 macrophage mannose receptor 1-like [Oncorhynchus keta]XP_052376209.1 macrophage mannose receptor 1-like [Oncorhynchus keta]XP_052376210.1 macrophage